MKRTFSISRKALQQTVFYTVLFSLLAHGYRFLNMSFSGDAAQISQAEEIAYQISIGRFLQPILWMIRGYITAPLTIGLFATAALTGSAILIVSLLGLTSRLSIILVCGILATNETLSVSYATYLPWVDVYMIAFFFAMAGVYVSERWRWGFIGSSLLYFFSLGLYQSYTQTAVVMIILLLTMKLFHGERIGIIWLEGIKACVSLLAGLLLYYITVIYMPELTGIQAFDDYNSARNATVFSLHDLPGFFIKAYVYPFQFFTRASDSAFIPSVMTFSLLVLALPFLLFHLRRLSLPGIFTALFLFAILPFGANYAALISKGIVHPLMVYSFFFLYVMVIVLFEHTDTARIPFKMPLKLCKCISTLLICIMVCQNILTSNQLYLRRDLEFYSTTSAATRILKHADQIEGYIPGETPVCILGYLPSSKISLVRPGFESLSNLQGMRYTYAASYETSTPWYFQMILGYPVNFVSTQEQWDYQRSGIGEAIPLFPDENCYQMIDGILFIRLS